MGELWRDLVETLRRWPALWLPVLLADLLSYAVNLGRNGLLRLLVLHQTAQHSVFGGPVVHGPMTASAMESTTVIALLLSWLTYFFRTLFYAGAFVATAALLRAFSERDQRPAAQVAPAMGRHWGGMLELALRGLAVYAIAALVLSWLTPYLTRHGHAAVVHNGWFGFVVSLVVLLTLSWLLPPVGLRVLSGHEPKPLLARSAQQFAMVPVLVAALLAWFVGANARELAQAPAGARYPLEIVGSLVVALPYVLLFIGVALRARRQVREAVAEAAD